MVVDPVAFPSVGSDVGDLFHAGDFLFSALLKDLLGIIFIFGAS